MAKPLKAAKFSQKREYVVCKRCICPPCFIPSHGDVFFYRPKISALVTGFRYAVTRSSSAMRLA